MFHITAGRNVVGVITTRFILPLAEKFLVCAVVNIRSLRQMICFVKIVNLNMAIQKMKCTQPVVVAADEFYMMTLIM